MSEPQHWHLAQLNIAHLKAPLDSPVLSDFVANLDLINALAEASPGFVWRLKDDGGNATAIRPFGDDYIVNLSVWTDVESLRTFVYESAHIEILKRKKEWFQRMQRAYSVLWWIPAGTTPDATEAKARLGLLDQHGPTNEAFTFAKTFSVPTTV